MIYKFEYDSGVVTGGVSLQMLTSYISELRSWLQEANIGFISDISDITSGQEGYSAQAKIVVRTHLNATITFIISYGGYSSIELSQYIQVESLGLAGIQLYIGEHNSTATSIGQNLSRITSGLEIVESDKGTVYFLVYTSNNTKNKPAISSFYFTRPTTIFPNSQGATKSTVLFGVGATIYSSVSSTLTLRQNPFSYFKDGSVIVLTTNLITSGNNPICTTEVIYINTSYANGTISITPGSKVLLNGLRYRSVANGVLAPYY
ncbi:MAG: hypothetical protein LBR74_09405 [Eubacterium sp.]|jgi:hypothetical protein|nr:hypothetical protein [Eubacterium sp.]